MINLRPPSFAHSFSLLWRPKHFSVRRLSRLENRERGRERSFDVLRYQTRVISSV